MFDPAHLAADRYDAVFLAEGQAQVTFKVSQNIWLIAPRGKKKTSLTLKRGETTVHSHVLDLTNERDRNTFLLNDRVATAGTPERQELLDLQVVRDGFSARSHLQLAPSVAALPDLANAWEASLMRHGNGIASNLANVETILAHNDDWKGVLAFDDFAQRVVKRKAPPYTGGAVGPWSDLDDTSTTAWLQKNYDLGCGVEVVSRAVDVVANRAGFRPIREYLAGLKWDGQLRLDKWLSSYLGAADNSYTRAIGAKWMIAAVARVFEPGAKVDTMLILEGPQGARKSTALQTLASSQWFTDDLAEFGSKDSAMQLQGVWIIELSELDALGKAEIARTKAFISRKIDRIVPKYGKHTKELPRQCVFAGTVNLDNYLRDETGGRRFWPIAVGNIDLTALAANREQLWAEATSRYRAREQWHLSESENALAKAEQAARYQADPWQEEIEAIISGKPLASSDEILTRLGIDIAKRTQTEKNRVSRCLQHAGWERKQIRDLSGKQVWRYVPTALSPVTSRNH